MGRKALTENQKKLNHIKRIIKGKGDYNDSLGRIITLLDEKPDNYDDIIVNILVNMDHNWDNYDEYSQFILGLLFSPLYHDEITPLLYRSGVIDSDDIYDVDIE